MTLQRTLPLLFLTLCALAPAFGQRLIPPFDSFSKDKPAYITLQDGARLEGEIADIDRKKGLIEEITIKDKTGKKHQLAADKIQSMYLPASGWAKFTNAMDEMGDAQQWDNSDIDRGTIAKGYAYFEQSEVVLKKKTQTLLLQLLNPTFAGKVRVYYDPFANETTSFGVGGITVAGGDAKSYYVKKGTATAFKLAKKNYDEEFARLFDNCKSVLDPKDKHPRWVDFEEHLYRHARGCE